jgi:hypothetical protein
LQDVEQVSPDSQALWHKVCPEQFFRRLSENSNRNDDQLSNLKVCQMNGQNDHSWCLSQKDHGGLSISPSFDHPLVRLFLLAAIFTEVISRGNDPRIPYVTPTHVIPTDLSHHPSIFTEVCFSWLQFLLKSFPGEIPLGVT